MGHQDGTWLNGMDLLILLLHTLCLTSWHDGRGICSLTDGCHSRLKVSHLPLAYRVAPITITSVTLNTRDGSWQSLSGRISNSTHERPRQVKAEREYLSVVIRKSCADRARELGTRSNQRHLRPSTSFPGKTVT